MYSSSQGCHTAVGTHMPYGITQCYLPPSRGDISTLTPAEAGTWFSDPGGIQRWVDVLFVWSEVQTCIWPCWCHCHSLSLASEKSRLVLPFWYRLTRVVPDKGPLNMCVCGIVAGDWWSELVGAYDERPGDKHGLCRTYQRVHRNWQRGITRYISLLFADDVR